MQSRRPLVLLIVLLCAVAVFACRGDLQTPSSPDLTASPVTPVTPGSFAVGSTRSIAFPFAMLDDLAVEKTGASGSGTVKVIGGEVAAKVKAQGLRPGHEYELNVTIDFASVQTFGPVTADSHGRVRFEGDIRLDPGDYRLDLFVTHPHPTIKRKNLLLPGLLNRDTLLRCFPAVFLTIV